MNEPRKFLINKKQKLQEDLVKRISQFEQETGLTVTEIGFSRPDDPAGASELKPDDMHITVELVA